MNGTEGYPSVDINLEPSVYSFLKDRCDEFGNKIAWIDVVQKISWTYTELFRRVGQLRNFILANESCHSGLVAIYAFNTIESCASLFALLTLPRTAVLLRSSFKYREALSALQLSRCSTIITDVEHLDIVLRIKEELDCIKTIFLIGPTKSEEFPSISTLIQRRPLDDSLNANEELAAANHLGEVAFLLPTSGTSGSPRLVAHTQSAFLHALHVCVKSIRIMSEQENALLASGLGDATGVGCVGCSLNAGGTLVIVKGCSMTFENFRNVCEEYQISGFMVTPSMAMSILSKAKGAPINSVTSVICSGGAPLRGLEKLLRRWFPNLVQLRNMLGLTEAMLYVAITPYNEFDLHSVGYPPPGCELRILDTDTGEEVATGEIGEIVMRSPCVMKGYFDNRLGTSSACTEDGWLKTDDLGYKDPTTGRYHYLGRINEVIVCQDNRLYPSELEKALLEHPSVADVAVIGVAHPCLGEAPTALVELRQGARPSETLRKDLAALVESQFSYYKRLYGGVFFVPELPRTEWNNIARRKLKSLYEEVAG